MNINFLVHERETLIQTKLHSDRANYQATIWRRSLQSCPVVPSAVGHGWVQEDGLKIKWMNGDPASVTVLEFLACSCSRICKLPNCSCISNGLQCTEMCRLKECTNRREDEVIENDASEISSNDEDAEYNNDKHFLI